METHDLEQRIFEKNYIKLLVPICVVLVLAYLNYAINYAVGYKLVYVHHSHAVAIIFGCYWASFNWSY